MGRPSKYAPAIFAVLLCGVFLSACGGGGEGTTGPIPATSTTHAGVVSARSADFQKYSGKGSGKLHLAEFGTEANRSDRLVVQRLLRAYLQTTGADEWGRACGYASEVLRSQIDELARRSERIPKPSCGEILQALAQSSNGKDGEPAAVYAPHGVASLRIKEGPGGGFALFHGGDGTDYWVTVNRDKGRWEVSSPAPQAFDSQG